MIQLGVYLKNYKKEFPGVYYIASYLNGGKLSTENWAGSLECFGGESVISQSHWDFFFYFLLLCLIDKVILCFRERIKQHCVSLQNGQADVMVDFWFYMDTSS